MEKFLLSWSLILVLLIKSAFLQNPRNCGVPKVRRIELIVHGYDTRAGDWPWHVAIYHRDRTTTKYACGGTLISEAFVLTAAHCVINQANRHQLSVNRIFVRLGVHNLYALNGETLQEHGVERIHQPKDFSVSQGLKNDIALLQLATIADFDDYVQPACVSLAKDLTGQFGTVVGWGVTEDDELSASLKSTQMPVIEDLKCLGSNRQVFGATLDEGIFCAGYINGTGVCNGDSGGGLFFHKDNAWYLGGIVSFSETRGLGEKLCQTKGYAAFTKVYKYLPWISSITKQQFLIDLNRCEPVNPQPNRNYPNLLPRNCGVYNSNRIYDGLKAKVFEFPWMALLRYPKELLEKHDYMNVCAGTLINKRYVLTAVGCVEKSKLPSTVILGEHTIGQDVDCNEQDGERECAPPVQEFGIECIVWHQNFTGYVNNSIALIRLDKDVIFEDHIQPICLPLSASLKKLNHPRYLITGWGNVNVYGHLPPSLQKSATTVVNISRCKEILWTWPLDEQYQHCMDERACSGDVGGPMGYPVNSNGGGGLRFVQFGIISYSDGCGTRPSLYTKVAQYMDWIVANMRP